MDDALVLRDPLVGDEPVLAEHLIGCLRQQGTEDRFLARVGYALEHALASGVGCREELPFPGPPAARRHCA